MLRNLLFLLLAIVLLSGTAALADPTAAIVTDESVAAEQKRQYSEAQIKLQEARQALDKAKEQEKRAQEEFDRQQQQNQDNPDPLFGGVISRGGLDAAIKNRKAAEQKVNEAQAALDKFPASQIPQNTPPPANNNTDGGNTPADASGNPVAPSEETVTPEGEQNWYETCFVCVLFKSVDDAKKKFAPLAFNVIAKGLANLLMIALALWLLVQAAQLLLPFGPGTRPRELYNTIVIRICLTFAVLVALGNYQFFWKIHETIDSVGIRSIGAMISATIKATDMRGIDTTCSTPPTLKGGEDFDSSNELICNMEQMQKLLGTGLRVGMELLKSFMDRDFGDNFSAGIDQTGARPNIAGGAWLAGVILVGLYGALAFTLPMRFFDLILKWTIITIFSPALVAAFLFPQTRNISINALKILIQSALTLLVMGIIVSTGAVLISYLLANGGDTGGMTIEQLTTEKLDNPIINPVFWQLAAIALLLNSLLGAAPNIAQAMVNVQGAPKFPKAGEAIAGKIFGLATGMIGGALGKPGAVAGRIMNRSLNRRRQTNATIRQQILLNRKRNPDRP